MNKKQKKDDAFILAIDDEIEYISNCQIHGDTAKIRKDAILKILAISTETQRLYFIVRSLIMGLISATATFSIVYYFTAINFFQTFLLGIFLFVFSLVTSRLLDRKVLNLTRKIIRRLEKYEKIKRVILNNL